MTPALVVLPNGPTEAEVGPTGPVPTTQRTVALQAATSPAVGDGAHASAHDLSLARTQAVRAGVPAAAVAVASPRVLEATPPQSVPNDLAVIGITWSSSVGRSTVVQYRTHETGAWQPWQAIDIDPSKAATGEGGRAGSDPIVVTSADQVQVRVLGPAGGAPADAKLSVIDPGDASSDHNIGVAQPGAAQAAAARPTIHTRREWGADESWRKGSPAYTSYRGVIVHHTAGSNDYSPSQVPAILRGIYAFHTRDRGWSDVAYNFLVDKWGRVWEGRYGGITRSVQGAHALGYNTQTMGVSIMGDYMKTDVSAAAIRSMEQVIAWKAGLSGFDPAGMTTLYGRREPVVQGHRDVGQTTCPGTYIYSKLPQIRRTSRALMSGGVAPAGSGSSAGGGTSAGSQPSNAGAAAVLMRSDASGMLLRTTPVGATDMSYASRLSSSNWAGYDAVLAAGDLDRDGYSDVLARVARTGELVFFRGGAGNVLVGAATVGRGWSGMMHMSAGADLTGDGRGDIVAVQAATGRLYVYPGDGTGRFGRPTQIGRGFSSLAKLAGVGDFNGDGKADLLGVTKAGAARLYLGSGRSRLAGSFAINGAWGAYSTLVGLPGRRAVFGVDDAGTGWMIARSGTTTVRATKVAPTFRGLHVFNG